MVLIYAEVILIPSLLALRQHTTTGLSDSPGTTNVYQIGNFGDENRGDNHGYHDQQCRFSEPHLPAPATPY